MKIDDLAIFSIGIKNAKGGAASEEEFSVSSNIQTVKFRARATGELTSKSLDVAASLKRVGKTTTVTPEGGGNTPEP